MYFTSRKPTWARTAIQKLLASLSVVPAGPLLVTPEIHLFQGNLVFDQDSTLATFTAQEADFTGYAKVPLPALAGPLNLMPGVEGMLGNGHFILGSPATVSQNVGGYWVDYGVGADWAIAESFGTQIPLAFPGDFIDLSILFGLPFLVQTSV
jgi:hypothetical protein